MPQTMLLSDILNWNRRPVAGPPMPAATKSESKPLTVSDLLGRGDAFLHNGGLSGVLDRSSETWRRLGDFMTNLEAIMAGTSPDRMRSFNRGGMDLMKGAVAPSGDPYSDFLAAGSMGLQGAHAPKAGAVAGKTSQELTALQRAELTPEQLEKLDALRASDPTFRSASPYLTPLEAGKIIASKPNVDTFTRLLDLLPTAERMSALAKAGAPKRGWYRASTQAILDVFGKDDAPRFAALLASMSPQTSVEMNLLNTINTWKNWVQAGRPTDPQQILEVMGKSVQGGKGVDSVLPAWINNAQRALSAKDPLKTVLSGPKVDSFYRNLADDVYRVTNDAWMSNVFGVDQGLFAGSANAAQLAKGDPGFSPGYIATNARVRQGAQRAGMYPSEGQETIWSVAMPLYEMQAKTGIPAREILQRGLLTPREIRGTPDFSTLFKDPQIAGPLSEVGYGQKLSDLASYQWGNRFPSLTAGEQRELDAAARTLEELRAGRARETRSRTVVPVSGGRPASTYAYETAEYVPARGTGHLEPLIDEPFSSRQAFTSRAAGAFKNLQLRDILHEALGLDTLQTRPMTGAWRPDGEVLGVPGSRLPIETNPGVAIGAEVPVKQAGTLGVPKAEANKLTAAAAARGAMTAQLGSPWNAQIPGDSGLSLHIPAEGKADPEAMKMLSSLAGGDFSLADTGAGVNVLNWTKEPLDDLAAQRISDLLGSGKGVRTHNVSDYVDYSNEWGRAPGSGSVTDKMLGYVDKLSPADQSRLDRAIRQPAGDLWDLYTQTAANRKMSVRPDLMNLLATVRDQGLTGLRSALRSGAYLPAGIAAALSLGGLQQTEDRDAGPR